MFSVNRAGKFFFDSDTTPCFTVFVDGSSELFQKVLECFHSHQDARELIGIDWESPWKSALSFVEIVEILTSYAKSNFDEVRKLAFFKALSQCQRFISRSEIHLLLASLRNVETGEFLVDPLGDYGLWTDYARDCTLFGMLLKAVTLKYLLRDSAIYFFSVDKFKDALKDIGNPISEFTAFFKTAHYDQVRADHLLLSDAELPVLFINRCGEMISMRMQENQLFIRCNFFCGTWKFTHAKPPSNPNLPLHNAWALKGFL